MFALETWKCHIMTSKVCLKSVFMTSQHLSSPPAYHWYTGQTSSGLMGPVEVEVLTINPKAVVSGVWVAQLA